MDIKKLLNPSARGVAAASHGVVDENPLRSNKSSSSSSRISRQSVTPRGLPEEPHRYHRYPTVGSSSAGPTTARSSISSLSSFNSSNSHSSLTTLSSNGSLSKGSLASPIHEASGHSTKPDFRIPIYAFDITQPCTRPAPRGAYTPSESDYSPSTTMAQYFPSYTEMLPDRNNAGDLRDGSSLTTLADLATSHSLKKYHVEDECVDPMKSYTGSQHYEGMSAQSYVSQLRQRADHTPKQSLSYNHITTQDTYALSRLESDSVERSSHMLNAMSPSSMHGQSPLGRPASRGFDADLFSSPKCSYVEDCNTSSPLRKVVSHIFGRNKLSTRQIPKNIWVYYCRKHYQRSRYRDPKGFAKLQCDLVRRQVERLAAWGGVEDWVIKVRRREEIRISKESRGALSHSPEGSDEFDDDYHSTQRGVSDVHWITSMTGSGKTVDDVRLLLRRIEVETIDRGGIFPDVEILPNVRPSAIAGDMDLLSRTQNMESERSLASIPEGSKAKKSKGLIEAFISPRKQLPSRKSLEESMVMTGSTVSAQSKLQKANRSTFTQELSPQSLDDEEGALSPARPKRKASKPLPITVLPSEDVGPLENNFNGHGYSRFPEIQQVDPEIENSKLLKYRSKRVRPGILSVRAEPDSYYDFQRPLSPVSSVETRRHSLTSEMLPLSVLADNLSLAGLPLSPTKATGETFCTFKSKDLNIVLVTPPPSAYGDGSRATSEHLETKDGEISQLGVTEAQTLLTIDPESDCPVLAVEVPQHVRDFVMGSWSKKRAVRMQNLFGDQITKPAEPHSLRYQSAPSPRRKGSSSSSSAKNPNLLSKRFSPQSEQDYVVLAKDRFVRPSVRQLRTVSFALQSEPAEEPVILPHDMQKRSSLSLLTKPNSNPSPSNRRHHRASSAGPVSRRSATSVLMKRTLTTPPKDTLGSNRPWSRGQAKARIY